MFSKENSDKWGYVYRNDDGKITDLAPGTQKEVNLGNELHACLEAIDFNNVNIRLG